MVTAVITSIIAYVTTNIDDIFVIMLLFAQVSGAAKTKLIAGHFLGVALICAVSMLSALGLQNLPLKYIGLLGFVPICLGIRAWCSRNKAEENDLAAGMLSMAMITLGNGADNIGMYIPLFTVFSGAERLLAVVVFALMTALWLWLAHALTTLPRLKALIEKYKSVVIPAVFILLGIFIIVDSGLLG